MQTINPEPMFPPRMTTDDGAQRRVGVEIEFAAVSAREAARIVQSLYGGEIIAEGAHRFRVCGTRLGEFVAELDSSYVHPASGTETAAQSLFAHLADRVRELFGDIGSLVVPCEVACPPIPLAELARLEKLVEALGSAGAKGTWANPLYAFGAQFNPEIAAPTAEWIASVLKAHLLLSEWLRAVMAIDLSRRILAYAQPFPAPYAMRTVDPGYWPDMTALIDDYLAVNPTRNRELDLTPLFAWFDEARVRRALPYEKIKRRPAFHYRLPDANVGAPGWSLALEWNRWCVVERLAEDRAALDAMGREYIETQSVLLPGDWALRASEWLVTRAASSPAGPALARRAG